MNTNWNFFHRFGFSFTFLFFGFWLIDSFLGSLIPFIRDFFHWLVPLFSKTFRIVPYDIVTFANGSGDTTYNWVLILLIFIVSVTGSVVWGIFAKNNQNYDRLHYWLMVALRFFVAITLIEYGLIKI